MSERRKIEERLRKKELEIQGLDEKLKAGRVYVQALRDVLKLLSEDGEETPSDSVLRAGSSVAQARDAILAGGQPVHVNDLLISLGREPTREARASLTSSLAAYVRRGEIFTRPAPNTFGLIELGDTAIGQEADEPPPGFGVVSSSAQQLAESSDDDIPF